MDHAFERARAAYGTGAYDDATLEFLFPQLKESEDERIRKALVAEFEKKVEKGFEWKDGIPNNAVISWLEKQKESSHVEETCKENPDSFTDDRVRKFLIWIVNNVLDNIRGLALSTEQIKELIDNYRGITNSDMLAWLEKQKEQKPAEWSEEDEIFKTREEALKWVEKIRKKYGKVH